MKSILNKKIKINSIYAKTWKYIIIFSFFVLGFIWLFQIFFLDKLYEKTKIRDLKNAINSIEESYENRTFIDNIEDIAEENSICIQVISNNSTVYNARFDKGCSVDIYKYNIKFDEANTYRITNPRFNNEILINTLNLDDHTTVYVSASLEPVEGAVALLKKRFFKVIILVFILSVVLGAYVSKRFVKPIEDMTQTAKKIKNGDYSAVFTTEENIAEFQELAVMLNDAKNAYETVGMLRREIIANVSHDLKTPLTMIKAYAEMIKDLKMSKDKQNENLDIIIDETDRLNLLVNDILELSVIESDTQNLKIEKFDLTKLIKSILKRYIYLEDYTFKFDYTEKLIVKADIHRIEQVIYNLINNAVNYTGDDKTVTIKIENKNSYARVSIVDTGKGLKKEDLKLIWKKYYRADKTHKREKIGTGIGLSIVESILVKHNFKYGVTSKRGEGTTFWFDINKE